MLLAALFLSALLFVTVGEFYFAVEENYHADAEARVGSADLIIRPSTEGGSRFVPHSVTESIAEVTEDALGLLSLPVTISSADASHGQGIALTAAALDLSSVDRFFSLSLIEAMPIPGESLSSAACMTEEASRALGVSVGDSISVSLLGYDFELTVYAISNRPILGELPLLFDIRTALRALGAVSPVFSLFEEDNLPYTTLYVRLSEGVSPENAIKTLHSSESGKGYYAETAGDAAREEFAPLRRIIFLTVLLSAAVMASVLIFFSFRILAERRIRSALPFSLSGMPEGRIFLALCCELLLSLLLACSLAFLFAYAAFPALFSSLFVYASVELTLRGACLALLFELLCGGVSLLFFRYVGKRGGKERGKHALTPLVISLFSAGGALLLGVLLPVRFRYIASACFLLGSLPALFCGIPLLLARLSRSLFPLLFRRRPALSLALRNSAALPEMRHLHAILSAILALAVLPISAYFFCGTLRARNEEMLDASYVISHASPAMAEELAELPGVSGVSSAFLSPASLAHDKIVYLVSVSDPSFLPGGVSPTGDGIFLSPEAASLVGASLGEPVTVFTEKRSHTFILTGYTPENSLFAYINAEAVGFEERMLLVRGEKRAEVRECLAESVALFGAYVTELDTVYARVTDAFALFSDVMRAYLLLILLCAGVGCADLLYVCYSGRREQFASLSLIGMSRGCIFRMVICELVGLVCIALALGAFFGGGLLFAFDRAISSFGFSLFF